MLNQIKNILLAEDDPDDVEMFQEAVNEICSGVSLVIATDGKKLMKLLASIPPPDVIFLDLNMPCKNGKECLTEIRSNSAYNYLPVIILSTSSEKKEIEYCLNLGANHYLIKPSSYQGITSIVKLLCTGYLYPKTFILKADKR